MIPSPSLPSRTWEWMLMAVGGRLDLCVHSSRPAGDGARTDELTLLCCGELEREVSGGKVTGNLLRVRGGDNRGGKSPQLY